MNDFVIITDSCCDLTQEMYKEANVEVVPLSVNFRGAFHYEGTDLDIKEVYAALANGEVAQTAAANPKQWVGSMEPHLQAGKDVLVLAFSSGLSTTYQSACLAADELAEKYPERKIRVVDTLCASMGQGLLVWYAAQRRQEGMDIEQTAQWVVENRLHLCHWFTVEDLMYLKRGGRVSAATALVGTMLNIKPVLHVDDEGHLINVKTARGRKASLNALAAKLGETGLPGENDTVFISHGDCLADAEYLANLVKEKYGVKKVYINYVGAVIGSHAGPGVMALFFLGSQR